MLDTGDLVQPDPPMPSRRIRALQLHLAIDALAFILVAKHLDVRPHGDHAFATAAIAQEQHDMAVALQFMHQRLKPANAVLVGDYAFCLVAHDSASIDRPFHPPYSWKRQERVKPSDPPSTPAPERLPAAHPCQAGPPARAAARR